MATGIVKWFSSQKGYGFITPDEGNKDIFIHINAVQNSGLKGLAENQRIEFEIQDDRQGKKINR